MATNNTTTTASVPTMTFDPSSRMSYVYLYGQDDPRQVSYTLPTICADDERLALLVHLGQVEDSSIFVRAQVGLLAEDEPDNGTRVIPASDFLGVDTTEYLAVEEDEFPVLIFINEDDTDEDDNDEGDDFDPNDQSLTLPPFPISLGFEGDSSTIEPLHFLQMEAEQIQLDMFVDDQGDEVVVGVEFIGLKAPDYPFVDGQPVSLAEAFGLN